MLNPAGVRDTAVVCPTDRLPGVGMGRAGTLLHKGDITGGLV